jgi:hypothetical protein
MTVVVEHSHWKKHSYNYIEDVSDMTGFRSICKYNEMDAKAATVANTTSVLKGCSLFIDTLFMDFDDCEKNANDFHKWLKSNEIYNERYDSGGRSVHFHIPVLIPPSPWAAYTCKQYVKSWTKYADTSFYHHAGLFRLPGTVHEKTGRPKTLVEAGGCYPLEFEICEPQNKFEVLDVDLSALQFALISYEGMLHQHILPGNRHITLWKISKQFESAGLSYSTTLELMERLNESWYDPKTTEEVEIAVKGAFKSLR